MGAKRKTRSNAPKKRASPSKRKEHFVKGVLVRGEAVPEGQPLLPGTTHEVIASGKGKPTLRRKRFSLA